MYRSIKQQLQGRKWLTVGIFAMAATLLVLSQTAQAQCPQTLSDIQWVSPDPSHPLSVSRLLNQGLMNCTTPIYFGLHRGAYTRAMDLDPGNQPTPVNLGSGTAAAQGLASSTVVTSAAGTFPVYPQSLAAVAISAYQNYLSGNSNHLPTNIDPTGTLTFQDAVYQAWPAIIELDPRQDSTGTWYLFHGVYTNSDALTPGVDPNNPTQSPLPTSQATLASDQSLYRATPLLGGYLGSSSAPSIDQMATAQEILDQIMTDPSVNMVLQLHTRTYSDTLNFYTWLLQTWAPGHTNAQMINVIGRIYFCVDLNKMTPQGQGSNSNDYNNLNFLNLWQTAVVGILSQTHSMYPTMPLGNFPPVALMVNFYDDTNLNTQTDVNNAFAILQSAQSYTAVKYLGLEITDENSPINAQLQTLGQEAKSLLGMQIGKSVLTSDHFLSVTDSSGNAAVKYGATKSEAPAQLVTGNNSIVNGTSFQTLWANNQANLVDLNYSLSFQLGVEDTTPGSAMNVYDPVDNTGTALTQVQPTIVLSDLPLIHGAKLNGEVRAVFQGTYISPSCTAGYPDCNEPNNPGATIYTLCAPENGTCSFTGDRNVAFGANGSFTYTTVTNTTACNNATLAPKGDPAPGVVKACYYGPPISYWKPTVPNTPSYGTIYCADEGEFCPYDGTALPEMAANGKWTTTLFNLSDGYQCDVAETFYLWGDPAYGFRKACFYAIPEQYEITHNGPAGYQWCASEGGTCQFKGRGRIAYGATSTLGSQMFRFQVFDGGVSCSTAAFGGTDPALYYTKDCYYQVTTANSGATGTQVGGGSPGSTSTCDIYASGGTPCVAAHSTVRALFGAYNGPLYQVKRASDGTTTNINTLTVGGYANAPAQDAFCSGTTCTITMIYDQSSYGNNLAIEGPGGTVTTADAGAIANALPITINGNEAYGVSVTPGVGYRNNATSGVAKGSSPEGMYMVTSGTNVNGLCCFDYGNAEETGADDGDGRMDALNFGTFCEFAPCSGSGPWVEADMENGQYMGNGNNLNDESNRSNFVTATHKNDGQTTFALKDGNAQSGGLNTDYSGSLPTGYNPSYIPMRLEGAIVLGTGGDNSNWGQGSFFEGAMTSGYPSDATESAVQANIVAAGYGGNSNPTYNEAPSYTGPNDPNGPGPQDGFASPAAEQPNDLMGSKPALATFNGNLYVAFKSNDSRNELYVTSSQSGSNFPTATGYPNILIGGAPAMAVFRDQLFIAFQANDTGHTLHVTSSLDGVTWPAAAQEPNILIGGAPAMAVFNSQLCISFQANDSGHTLHVTCSSDGVTWPTAWQVPNVQIGSDPAMAVFDNKLYVAFRSNDANNTVWIASSTDGVNFTSTNLPGTMGPNSSPALVVSNNVLYYIYGADDLGNEMLVLSSTDGVTWQGPAAYLGVQMGATGPGAAGFGNGISVGFQSNDSRNVLFVTSKATEANTYTGPTGPGGIATGYGFEEPAVEQPNDLMGSKPALASFNGSLYLAFQADDPGHTLHVTSSSDGVSWPAAAQEPNVLIGSAPAMAVFNNQLYLAFQADDSSHTLFVTSSSDGVTWPTAAQEPNVLIGGAPAMVVFNNQLCISFQANDPGHTLHVTCSSDGVTWPAAWQVANVQIGSDPAMAVFGGKLYVAFRSNDANNTVWIASSTDGVNFTSTNLPGTTGGSSSPALVATSSGLTYIYGANDYDNEMMVLISTDGINWQGPWAYTGVQFGPTGPGATSFGADNASIYVGFQSNDARNVLFTTCGGGADPCPTN